MAAKRARANGEGSIFAYRNGYAAYAWVTTPTGRRQRKYVYGKTRAVVHAKWLELQRLAGQGPVATRLPTLDQYLNYWRGEVVRPNLAPATATSYDMFVRHYIKPDLGADGSTSSRSATCSPGSASSAPDACAQQRRGEEPDPRSAALLRPRQPLPTGRVRSTVRDAWMTLGIALSNPRPGLGRGRPRRP